LTNAALTQTAGADAKSHDKMDVASAAAGLGLGRGGDQDSLQLMEEKPSLKISQGLVDIADNGAQGLPEPSSDQIDDAEKSHLHQHQKDSPQHSLPQQDPSLVLTSEKRRGVYECDYCHADISQLPRIRCAVCPDFDLCLSCFATVDHQQTLQRLKAQASAHQAVVEDGAAANASLAGSGVSVAALAHDASHGYSVCASTRYPLFPTSRMLNLKGIVQSLEDKLNESTSNILDGDSTIDPTESRDGTGEVALGVEEQADKEAAVSISENKQVVEPVDAPVGEEGTSTSGGIEGFTLVDDPRSVWTVEEDLRLLDGIKTHGLGNWSDVSDAVVGHGSTGKTAKRCMERYLDDFLGRYGHIFPAYTLLEQEEAAPNQLGTNTSTGQGPEDDPSKDGGGVSTEGAPPADSSSTPAAQETTEVRSSKRRAVLMRSPSSNISMAARKKFKAVPTESLPGYQKLWQPYLPEGTTVGQEVGRDQTYKAEQSFVKMISQLESQEQVEKLRKEWAETKLFKPGGPTVLPMRPEDVATLPGAELAGFMPRRGDFDIEWDNDAEQLVADMEFLPGEPPQDRELKLKVLAIYNAKLEEREKRKRFVLSRKLYDYRSIQQEEEKLPQDERDLIHRMRLFERFHTPTEHKQFISDLLKAKRLRKEVAKLQMYRRIGIRTLAEAEKYELDKSRRSFHKATHRQKAADAMNAADAAASNAGDANVAPAKASDETISSSLWRRYRTSDRKVRKSITRGASAASDDPSVSIEGATATPENEDSPAVQGQKVSENEGVQPMEGAKEAASCAPDSALMNVDSPPKPHTILSEASTATAATTMAAMTVQLESTTSSQEEKALEERLPSTPVDISTLPGYHFLSAREVDLCRTLALAPRQYLDVKRVLLQESLAQGLLDTNSSKRSIAMIDTERRGNVIDFMVRSGWISSTLRPKETNVPSGGNGSDATA
jgi:hypothetical protein